MKKKLALLLAIVFVVAMFAGCSGGSSGDTKTADSANNNAAAADSTDKTDSTQDTGADVAELSGLDEYEIPSERYVYDLPLTENPETFTFWLVDNNNTVETYWGSYDKHPAYAWLEQQTNVHIDFMVLASGTATTNFAVLLASDDLCDFSKDITTYLSCAPSVAVLDEELFINVYDYKEYCPNYIYLSNVYFADDKNVHDTVYEDTDLITRFYKFEDGIHSNIGFGCRGDWLDALGMTVEDMMYYEGVHEYLLACKSEFGCEHPMFIPTTLDGSSTMFGGGYDIRAYCNPKGNGNNITNALRVVDGEVQLCWTTEECREYIQMLNDWYNEGLIDPDFMTNANDNKQTNAITGKLAYIMMLANDFKNYPDLSEIEGIYFTPMYKVQKYEGQVFHTGRGIKPCANGTLISTKCHNIELAVTWADFMYSEVCDMVVSYGFEDLSYYYGDDGKVYYTDIVVHNPDGYAYSNAIGLYTITGMMGKNFYNRNYAYTDEVYERSGAAAYERVQFWNTQKDDESYVWPAGAVLTSEQGNEFASVFADIDTYVIENYFAFVVGDKPMSEWDSFQEQMKTMGVERCVEIYQEAYDTYIAKH